MNDALDWALRRASGLKPNEVTTIPLKVLEKKLKRQAKLFKRSPEENARIVAELQAALNPDGTTHT